MYTYAQARTLITDLIDEVIDAEDPESEFMFNEIFNVKKMTRGQDVNYRIAGLGRPPERQIQELIADVNFTEGEKQTTSPANWGFQFGVPEEVIQDLADAGPHDGENAARLVTYAEVTERMKYAGFWRADTECAAKLLNGTSTAAKYVGRDGKALFSATQTGLDNPPTVQSNVNTGVSLTANNVMTDITAIDTQKDDRGGWLRKSRTYTVVTSPQLRWSAWEIFNTDKQVNTANNTKNPLYAMRDQIKHVVWNELGASYTGWFTFGDRHTLDWLWRLKPTFAKDADFAIHAIKYKMTMRGAGRHKDWRYTVGHPTS